MAVTIKDVAREAGVSHTTVSRALRNNPAIAAATRLRIQQIAHRMGYVPNTVARGLKTQRSNVVGVIISRFDDPFFAHVLNGIEDTLQNAGYNLFLAASEKDARKEGQIVDAMSQQRVDGVIICSTRFDPAQRRRLDEFGIATVLVNDQKRDAAGATVYHDDVSGSRELCRHLIALGHRRIAFLGNANGGATTEDRLRGYRLALELAGLPRNADWIVDAATGQANSGYAATMTLMDRVERPTAIVCFNDMLAIGALHALRALGIDAPTGCSITGFDNIDLAAFTFPPLTTFDQPKYALGEEAARMMISLFVGENGSREPVQLRGRLVVRQSTAAPPFA